ncbi:uncharacterized protein PHACADRAFT_196319 [Phanerochaete carnosa HHB-10118-sp]|uniref:Uncharacterized protein n=1 Tax=Phanerochaete carnosa (strain HHB-10118-sp) TaxID=650164 RepID=K5WTY1_PHACS|nr:uncharacterized protein PHACADRAFT_196319 [Phanerochaete carnosa HHB-10118-sp]EKM53877.1 hypothetical protein PHACADRAFT_196319 [Phanerochaete carnosa HHB-10118-sp]
MAQTPAGLNMLTIFVSRASTLKYENVPDDERPTPDELSQCRLYGVEEVTFREVNSATLAVLQVLFEPTTLQKITLLGEKSWYWQSDSFFVSFNVFLETTCQGITHLSLNTGYLGRGSIIDGCALTALRSLSRLEILELNIPRNLILSASVQFDKALAHAPETLSHLRLNLSPMAFEVLFRPSPRNIAHVSQLMDTLRSVRFTILVHSFESHSEVDVWRGWLERVLPAHLQGCYTLTVERDT